MASSKVKSIDNMNILEMAKTMEALRVSCEGLETLSEMKSRVRTELSQAEKTPSWSAGQAFSILSEAKEEDTRKRQVLLEFYTEADNFVDKMDEQILTLLQKHTGNVKENVKQHMKQLKQKEYFLLVAGETSSGKSSLVNLILGEEILPYSLLSTTSTICELKFGEERRIVAHFKDKDPETGQPTKTISLEQTAAGSSEQSYLEQISPYVHVKTDREEGSVFKKIELFWPHSLLQKGIVIIDSPGVGESEEMDEMVIQYLPEAFAFIYIINSANAGGVQRDRLEKLLQKAWKVSLGDQEEEKDGGEVLQDLLFSKCALFVCNKWDQVPKQEIQIVKNDVTKKLKRVWPGVDPESQIIYMSTEAANTAQNYGLITEDFSSLMNGMRSVVLKSIEARLELHWRWLDNLLTRIVFQAKAFVVNASRDNVEVKQKIKRIVDRLEVIEKQQDKVMVELHKCLNKQVDNAVQRLSEYLSSEEVKVGFTSWTMDEVPEEQSSWEETYEKITTVLSSRFREIVEQWEEDNKVFANSRVFLMQQFEDFYDDVESQLFDLQSDVTDAHGDVENPPKKTFRFRFTRKQRIAMGIVSGVVSGIGFGISFPALIPLLVFVCVAIEMTPHLREIWNAKKYQENKCTFMAQMSADYLADATKKKKLKEFVQDELKDAKLCLEKIEARLPELIQADKMLYKQLIAETHTQKQISDLYQPIWDESSQHRDQLALFGLTEVCAVKIPREGLDWKEDMSSCLGSGAFGAVYKGTMTRQGEVKPVALKVCSEELDVGNASEIMGEMKILRMLDHPHIVQFYGVSLLEKMDTVRMILVMEKCKGNLKSRIFKDAESVPGRSENPSVVGEVCRWAKEITDGLAYIHELGVVHRDLKLENILLSEENFVKIADVGLAKPEEFITGTFTGTPLYMAPEVFHRRVYDTKADIYSLGIMLWEMWYGQHAFADVPGGRRQDLFDWVDKGNRPVDRKGCKKPPLLWEQLMTQCWDGNPEQRPTAKECNKETSMLQVELETTDKAVIG